MPSSCVHTLVIGHRSWLQGHEHPSVMSCHTQPLNEPPLPIKIELRAVRTLEKVREKKDLLYLFTD